MVRLALSIPAGRLAVVGSSRERVEAAAELFAHDHERGGSGIERIELAGEPVWFKRSRLRAGARVRWTVKHLLGARLPRVREHDNLLWLRARGFRAPEPLAAGVLSSGGAPLAQFLVTRDVPDAIQLEPLLRRASEPDRGAVLDETARETARMHALGFVHHDLYPRNVLVLPASNAPRVAFLDAWAGGPPPQARGAAYDLACFLLRADRELAREEIDAFVARYAAVRAEHGSAIDADRLLARAKRIRARLVRRLIARPHELRGEPVPALEL